MMKSKSNARAWRGIGTVSALLALLIVVGMRPGIAHAEWAAGPQIEDVEAAVKKMNWVSRDDLINAALGSPKPAQILESQQAARQCERGARSLMDGGMSASTRIEVPKSMTDIRNYKEKNLKDSYGVSRGWTGTAPLADVERYCAEHQRLAWKALIRPELVYLAGQIASHEAAIARAVAQGRVDKHYGVVVGIDHKKCTELVTRAEKQGVPADTSVLLPKDKTRLQHDWTLTMGEVSEKVCGRLQAVADQAKGAGAKADKAKLAPYAKAFGGKKSGRYQAYVKHKMAHIKVYGPGRKLLTTPRAFAKAPRWYEVRHNTGTVHRPRWNMRVYSFTKKSYRKSKKSGRGKRPPKSAFR